MKARRTHRDNFLFLATALVFFLLVTAAMEEFLSVEDFPLIEIILVITLSIGVWSTKKEPRVFFAGLILTGAFALIAIAALFVEMKLLVALRAAALFAFFSLAAWTTLMQVLLVDEVDANVIVGAICVYVMIGILFAIAFAGMEAAMPGSIRRLAPGGLREQGAQYLYFSFACLTTLGFGDIVAASPLARVVAFLEAIVGQFYLAILIATLVGARSSKWHRRT